MGTQITEAVRSMETHASQISQVALRLAATYPYLPHLISVRPRPSADTAELDLQLSTFDDARVWATALGGELVIRESDHTNGFHGDANIHIDGVLVHVCAFRRFTAEERAEREAAEQVAA
ncbi:hypothetical protein [Streptomyces sp. STR69]|uniref:hypothetical protein n=1 Tax=Streptomyces sp. STR69 TaxID=1796942 RepID=UPI0021C8CEC6|nr:hypothetical protein [Streptomyces sp. STR69]